MRQKRMFSQQIIDSDAFLDMPSGSQLLYFHLSMRADDDGFIGNPKKIMRMIGSQEDEFKVLVAKRFVIHFESGVCVIKHWKIHNYLAKNRYYETKYTEEKALLETKSNNVYTEKQQCVDSSVYNLSTQVSDKKENKIKENKIKEKNIILHSEQSSHKPETNQIMDIFYAINPTLNYGNKSIRKYADLLISKFTFIEAKRMCEMAVSIQGKEFAPVVIDPRDMWNKLAKIKIYFDNQKNNSPEILKI